MYYLKILFFFLILTVLGCKKEVSETIRDPQFNAYDGYWVLGDSLYTMSVSPGDYYIIFKGNSTDKVMKAVQEEGFVIIEEPFFSSLAARFEEKYPLYEDFSYFGTMSIQGNGDISKIPDVIFSNHLYLFNGRKIGHTNLFTVGFNKDNQEDDIFRIVEYAHEHNLVPIGKGAVYVPIFLLACTNKSDGNPLEMCNWFMEETEFRDVTPGFIDEAFPFEPTW